MGCRDKGIQGNGDMSIEGYKVRGDKDTVI